MKGGSATRFRKGVVFNLRIIERDIARCLLLERAPVTFERATVLPLLLLFFFTARECITAGEANKGCIARVASDGTPLEIRLTVFPLP